MCTAVCGRSVSLARGLRTHRRVCGCRSSRSQVAAVAAMLGVGLPVALAIQPLQMELDVTSLEADFHSLKKADGSPITHVYASKGL